MTNIKYKMARKTKTKTSRASKSTKTTTPTETVTTTPVVTNTVVSNTVETPASTEPTLTDSFNALLTQLQSFRYQITQLSAQVRTLRSRSEREIKQAANAVILTANPVVS